MISAQILAPVALGLGEGATTLDDASLLIVDIHAGDVLRVDLDGDVRSLASFDHSVGAAVPTIDGQILVAGATGIAVIGDDRTIEPEHPIGGVRMNDGKADPVGRFVGGTMAEPVRDAAGCLWSFAGGSAAVLVPDVTISNGLCWSADGSTLFYIDTPTQRVDAFDYDVAAGTVSNRRMVVEIETGIGSPDGMTIDDEGALWVALWGGSAVHRYVDGLLDDIVECPTPFITSTTFVGTNLAITSAHEPAEDDPLAGHVFIADVGIGGPLPHRADPAVIFGS